MNSGRTKASVRASMKPGCLSSARSFSSGKTWVGAREVVDPRREEDDAGLEVNGEVAEAPEEVVVLPGADRVQLRLDLVELGAAAETQLVQLGRLDVDANRDDARRGVGEIRRDRHGREDVEIEQRLAGLVEAHGRVGFALLEVDGAPQGALREPRRPGTGAVRIEAVEA